MKNTKELLKIAIPAMIESLFMAVVALLDTWMVAPLGTGAIAAVSIAYQPKVFSYIMFMALGTATTITISQIFGRKDRVGANAVMLFALKAAALWAVVIAAILIIFAHPVLAAYRQQDTIDMAVTFMRILMVGMVFQGISGVMNSALRGIGQMKATLFSNLTVGLVDLAFNYLLIEGHLGFPSLGVAGAALATAISYVAGLGVSLSYLLKKEYFLNLSYSLKNHKSVAREDALEMRSNIINIFCENILMRIGFLVSNIIVATLGSFETSIYSVGMQLMNFNFAFGDGIQVAVMVLVGQCLGSKDRDAFKNCVARGIRLGLMISLMVAVGCWLFGGKFFHFFNKDADFLAAGKSISHVAAVIVPFHMARVIRTSLMRGLGDTRRPAFIGAICALGVNPPVSFCLAALLGMGQEGIWIGVLSTQLVWFILSEIVSRRDMKRTTAFD